MIVRGRRVIMEGALGERKREGESGREMAGGEPWGVV